ncbi:hypothetical protein niasHT_038222 [Heterodera trifolii]|uniref:Phosphatidic acid phosphatase type 2/haloperoxidase domain-containing protein n=1 Tax=Heterodera trifolii TaxID=157864 RepID=A0ABD2IXJ2_9BILA
MKNRRITGDLSLGRICCDLIVILCLAVPLLIFHEWVKPYKRGFYCDDESIRYPYRPSTVSRQMLIVIGIMVPTMLIMGTELLRSLVWERQCPDEFGMYRYKKYNVHRLIVRFYVFIGYFFLGICFNQLMVDIAKYTIGRHRPHFMDVCKPATQMPIRSPDGGTQMVLKEYRSNCPAEEHSYVTDFECLGDNKYLIHESMLSFYSGHSAFSFYAAWYTALYLQARIYRPLVSKLVLPAVQFALFGGAAFVAYTRVSNYKHHWSDVLVGTLIGSAIGVINAIFIAEVFHRREVPTQFRSKRRLLGKYTLVPPNTAGSSNNNDYQLETDGPPPPGTGTAPNRNNHFQLDTVRVADDGLRHGRPEATGSNYNNNNRVDSSASTAVAADPYFEQQQQQHHYHHHHPHQPQQIRMVPIRRQGGGGGGETDNVISKF